MSKTKYLRRLAWIVPATKFCPRFATHDNEGLCKATVFGGSMYATVAHDLYNYILMKKQPNVDMRFEILPALNDSIWTLD